MEMTIAEICNLVRSKLTKTKRFEKCDSILYSYEQNINYVFNTKNVGDNNSKNNKTQNLNSDKIRLFIIFVFILELE